MKTLLVAYHFPPDPAVGSQRALKVARALRDRGHQVVVITARLRNEREKFRTAEPGITVRAVNPLPGLRDIYAWFTRARSKPIATSTPETGNRPLARKALWKRFLISWMWIPDDRHGFILPALFVALWHTFRGTRLVYTTVPPFSTYMVGLFLRLLTWRPWVVEIRDPWTPGSWKSTDARTALSDAIERLLERICLRMATLVVAVTEGIASMSRHVLPASSSSKVIVIRNGIDKLATKAPPGPAPGSPARIVYVGTVYLHRDPRPFLRAVAAVRQQDHQPMLVEFVGDCRWFRGVSVEDEARALGLSDIVTFRDWMPQRECQEIVERANILLLLAQNQPSQVPNKLYDYLGMRVPILAFADADGESARMLRAIGRHVVVPGDDPAEAQQALKAALALTDSVVDSRASSELQQWTTEAQMERLARALEAYNDS